MDECKPLGAGGSEHGVRVLHVAVHQGGAVQVDPIKPTLIPPGTKLFKLQCDELLSNFVFNHDLRRYTKVSQMHRHLIPWAGLADSYGGGGGDGDGRLPGNAALDSAAATLAAGWTAMGDSGAKVLMVVQPAERNVFDQRLAGRCVLKR